jgi:hypothetical protein
MGSIWNNTWVVGIGGGMVSGFAVFFITNLIISRRERQEIRQRIQLANSEVIHSMRSLVAEKVLLPVGLLDSVLSSTARKYAVNKEDLYGANGLADDIINEIMNNPFLSSQQKVDYCDFVSQHKGAEAPADVSEHGRAQTRTEKDFLKEKSGRDISLILGAAAFSSVLLGVLSSSLGTGTVTLNKETIKNTLSIIAAAIIVPTFFLWALDFYRDWQELKRVQLEVKKVEAELGRAKPGAPGAQGEAGEG